MTTTALVGVSLYAPSSAGAEDVANQPGIEAQGGMIANSAAWDAYRSGLASAGSLNEDDFVVPSHSASKNPRDGSPDDQVFSGGKQLAEAQEPKQEEAGDPVTLGVIGVQGEGAFKRDRISSSKYVRPILDTPQSITVITEQVMEDQQTTSFQDLFRNVPGVSIQAGEGNPGAGDQLSIRGFTSRDDIFLDGARDVGNVRRDPFNLEAVEVFKGPSSTFQGRGTAGGAINQVTKTPEPAFFANVIVEGGTNQLKRGTVDVNVPLDEAGLADAAFRLNLMGHDQEFADRDVIEDERYGFAPSLTFGLGTPTQLTVAYQHMTQDNVPGAGIPNVRDAFLAGSPFFGQVAPVDDSSFFGQTQRDHERIQQDIATVRLAHEVNSSIEVENQFRFERTKNDSAISSPRIVNDGTGQLNPNTQVVGNAKFRDQTDRLFINQTDATIEFDTGPVAHTLATGFEIGHQDLTNNRRLDVNSPPTLLFNPDPNLALTTTEIGTFNGTRAEADSTFGGIYLMDTVEFSPYWQLSGGARWDYVKTRVQGIDRTGEFPGFVADRTRIDREFSGHGALTYKPMSNGSVYFAFGSSFAPSLSVGTENSGVFQPAGGNNNGPIEAGFDADPERTNTFELGTKWEVFDDALRLEGSLFRTIKTNARDVNLMDNSVTVNGKEQVQGFEVAAVGSVFPNWNVLLGYTYLDSEVKESNIQELSPSGQIVPREGLRVANTPKHTVSAWTTYTLPWAPIDLGFGAQFVGERMVFQGRTNRAIITADSFWKFDAMARYRFHENAELQLNVANLTDKDFIQGLGTAQSIPGEGRVAMLRLKFALP